MKRVVVSVAKGYSLDSATAGILNIYGYLSYVTSYRSFSIITFDCPEQYTDGLIEKLRALSVVKKVTWDEDKFSCDPVDTGALQISTSGSAEANTSGETNVSSNTRNLTGSGTGTIYVKVQNIGGANYYVFSSSSGGTYSRFNNQTGFLQGATYTFDQSDVSNQTHPLRFSVTPDGTHTTGGSEMSTGVTVTGTPGTDGVTQIVIGANTPSILYFYCTAHPGMGRYSTTPDRFGTINVHDYWHLDRITKQDRQYLNNTFSHNQDGDGVDIYVLDTGVRGASRPTGNNAALHPELYDPDFVTDLNGLSEQQNYRVYEVTGYTSPYSTNEDDNGHGTYCAILAAGRTAGVSRNAKIYALKCFNSGLSGSYSDILGAYQAVIDHNDSGNGNYKGNNRPAIINSSFGPTIPSQTYPYVELNDSGDDSGTDEEILDDIEGTIASTNNIIVVRSAGNGFKNSSDAFAGPIVGKCIAGTRTAGYADNTNGGINNVDTNQNKISVGATEYSDRWADFSNYGNGVTTVAPGARILTPAYDWTANTPYTNTTNYQTIAGTSFSGPIVTGIMAAWAGANGYTLSTANLPGLAKTFVRTGGSTGDITRGAVSYYPTNSIDDRRLIDNPYETLAGSAFLVVKFDPADSSHFIGNVGKKCQLRTTGSTAGASGTSSATYNITTTSPSFSYYTLNGSDRNGSVTGNNSTVTCYVGDTLNFNLSGVSGSHPFYLKTVQGTGTGNQVSTPVATGQGSTGTATVSWTPNTAGTYYYQCSNHNAMNGTITVQTAPGGSGGVVVGGIDVSALSQSGWLTIQAESAVNNTITLQNSSNATAGTTGGGSGNYLALIDPESKTHESIDGVVSTSTQLRSQTDTQEAAGTGTYTNVVYYPVDSGVDFKYDATGSSITTKRGAFFPYIDTTVTWVTGSGTIATYANGASVSVDLGLSGQTFANEPTFEQYTLSGDSIAASGLGLDTSTGLLSGTVTSDYLDTTFNFTVTENITGNSRSYNFTTTGTGVLVTVTGQPSNQSVEAGSGNTATFGPVAGTSSDGSTILFQWEFSSNGGVGWSNVSNGGGYSGATTNTLTVDDDYAKNSYQYRCKLDTNTAVTPAYTNAVTLTVFRVITISNQPTDSNPIAPAAASFTVAATTADSATVSYQWEKSENNDGTNFVQVNGATSATYTTGSTSYDDDYGDYYRCNLTAAGAASVTSSTARALIQRTINITAQPINVTGAVGGTVSFGVSGTTSDNDAGDITYQWQFSITSGASWSNVSTGSGGTTSTYTTATLSTVEDEYQYRCLLSAPGATTIPSNAATLQIETVTVVVSTQPTDQTVNETATATFTTLGGVTMSPVGGNAASSSFDTESFATPSGGGGGAEGQSSHEPSVTYQWEKSDDGVSFTTIGGATSASYTTGGLTYAVDNNDQYRCIINAVGASTPVTTNAVTLTVLRTFSITADPSNATANEGGTAAFSVTASTSSGTPTYQWERSDDGGVNYVTVGGATSATYTTPTLVYATDGADRYRCIVSLVGAAGSLTSNFAVLTVLRVITIQTQPQSQAVIEGGTATFNIGAQITSDVISYQWEKSTDNGLNFNAISGANSSTYTTPTTSYPTTPSEQFRCVLSNVAATTVTSTSATLTVNESEFVSAPTSVTPFIDTDTSKTLSRQPVITTAAYVSEYAGSTHFSTFWRIRRVADNVTVYDTTGTFVNGDTGNLTSFTVPSGVLDFDITYSVQVKFRDNNGLESAYTSAVNFSTPLVDQPDIQTITPAFNPTINVDPIQLKSGYQHSSSDWQFSPANTFATIVHQSLGNSTNLTQYTLPGAVNLSANTTYYVRIRFNVNPT